MASSDLIPLSDLQPTPSVRVRFVDDVETLRVLSDPIRLEILNLLMEGADRQPRTRTAKELAQELHQPQTKLYRHLKQLLAVSLIEVAETRLVSGIVQHRYRAGQVSLRLDEEFLGGSAPMDDKLRTLRSVLDRYRRGLFQVLRDGAEDQPAASGQRSGDTGAADEGDIRPTLAALSATIPVAQAKAFSERLNALVAEFKQIDSDQSGVPLHILMAYYVAQEP
ncbi:helix-turn-helix domain-containing protein [Streptomyces sodiiphilus]|uniref:helix-turn-helix domain-containing protein n=1 Tax=Streptomyces sodiiphilus TaxID=226217 RepID=UPI0031D535A4